MAIVAGVDFGTLSVRVTLMDSDNGFVLAGASAGYELKRTATAPLMGAQSHDDHMASLTSAMHEALQKADIQGSEVRALAIDTTGSSVVMVDDKLHPLADYYLWCDHQAHEEAREITQLGQAEELEALRWCGGTYSHEWGFAKVLHFLRYNPEKRAQFYTALEHCDMIAATLCGITARDELPRSLCSAGHKWMYGSRWGGFPPQAFFSRVDPLFDGILDKMAGRYLASDAIAGHLSKEWADKLGLAAGIPIPIGALDAHWDAIGSGGQPGDVVNVIGTSTCIISMGPADFDPVEGLCGVATDSVVPGFAGIEAGQSATGDVFSSIAKRASSDVATLVEGIEDFAPCQTGLLRLNWDNGDRTVLVRSDLSGVTLGWDLNHEARDELHSAIEGMALHVRIIIDRMCEGGLQLNRIVNAGGIPQKNDVLNQIYADVLNKQVFVPSVSPVGTGSCIVAAVAAGLYPDIQSAQKAMAPEARVFYPRTSHAAGYEKLYALYREAYFGFGEGHPVDLPGLLAELKNFRVSQGIF